MFWEQWEEPPNAGLMASKKYSRISLKFAANSLSQANIQTKTRRKSILRRVILLLLRTKLRVSEPLGHLWSDSDTGIVMSVSLPGPGSGWHSRYAELQMYLESRHSSSVWHTGRGQRHAGGDQMISWIPCFKYEMLVLLWTQKRKSLSQELTAL